MFRTGNPLYRARSGSWSGACRLVPRTETPKTLVPKPDFSCLTLGLHPVLVRLSKVPHFLMDTRIGAKGRAVASWPQKSKLNVQMDRRT